jgi:hypothetical protein
LRSTLRRIQARTITGLRIATTRLAAELRLRAVGARPRLRVIPITTERRVDVAGPAVSARTGWIEVVARRAAGTEVGARSLQARTGLVLSATALHRRDNSGTATIVATRIEVVARIAALDGRNEIAATTAVELTSTLRAGRTVTLRRDATTAIEVRAVLSFERRPHSARLIAVASHRRLELWPIVVAELCAARAFTAVVEALALERRLAFASGSARFVRALRAGLRTALPRTHRARADALESFLDVLELLGRELGAQFIQQRGVEVARSGAANVLARLSGARLAFAGLRVARGLAFAAGALGLR